MKKAIVAVCLMGLPLAGFADVLVTAHAQDGGTAILYNPDNGSVYTTAAFSGGLATLSTSTLSTFDKYAVTMTYGSSPTWRTDIYWGAGGGAVSGYKTYLDGQADDSVTALTGAITSRSFDPTLGSRSLSMTFAANGALSDYNNDINALDANILLYKPSASLADLVALTSINKIWDSATLLGPYDYSAAGWGSGYDLITLTKNGDFYADYLGKDLGGGAYELSFASAINPGGSSFNTGSIVDNPDGSVTFTSGAFANTEVLADFTPYYAMMDAAWMYDNNDNYTLMPNDDGLVLTNPDYLIPEPAVILMLLGGGGGLLVIRRFFMI